jgi:multiple sugar transport system ATP-binding protein
MANVVLENVCKVFDHGITAVNDFCLEIADKEFVVFVGPSGCGKSTTLRMIAGLEDVTSGNVYIDGELVNDADPKDRDIAMVFQNYALYPHMTVFDNMAFSLKIRRMPKYEIKEKVESVAEMLEIGALLHRKPKALSGGQRQRVAIGRAIVRDPKVFLLDEPLSNLDAKLRNQMRVELINLRKRIDTTFIYVTHDQTEAITLGDRIVVMKDGVIQQIGTSYEIFNYPANVFVAGFIGTPQMNFFEDAKLQRCGGSNGLYLLGTRFCVETIDGAAEIPETSDVVAGIRPEDFLISLEHGAGRLDARLEMTEWMGNEMIVHLKRGGENITARVMDAYLAKYLGNNQTKNVWLGLNAEHIHVFEAGTGARLPIACKCCPED